MKKKSTFVPPPIASQEVVEPNDGTDSLVDESREVLKEWSQTMSKLIL
jgi:hypothetical protein